MIEGMFTSGAMPALEQLAKFTGQRHRMLVNNIANLSTPNYKPTDLSVDAFQKQLARAIDERRNSPGGPTGELNMPDIKPAELGDNILFHDRNNRNLEKTMASLAENTMTHNAALDMLHNQFSMLTTAIRGQV